MQDFDGAKLAILVGDRIVTILRDDDPAIAWPGFWDLPGGGREGCETPEACVLRETREELGLTLGPDDLHWRMSETTEQGVPVWFFVSEQPDFRPDTIRFGPEGQRWEMQGIDGFLTGEKTIPTLRKRLNLYLKIRRTGP